MKVFRADGDCGDFDPYDVTITIETKRDQELLKDMTHSNCSVPQAVVNYKGKGEGGRNRYTEVQTFLKELQRALGGS